MTTTLGMVEAWKVAFVAHSGPIGTRRLRSYCCLVSNVCGRADAWYFTFCNGKTMIN